jgi:hypothetical protein
LKLSIEIFFIVFSGAMPDLGKKGDKMPDLAFFGPKLYYKNVIKIDSAGIAVSAYYEVPFLDLIGPENINPKSSDRARIFRPNSALHN